MDSAIALNYSNVMSNTKETKKDVLARIKNKLERAKLDLIYTELQNENIPFNKGYASVNDLQNALKKSLNELDYNKVVQIIDKINSELDTMVNSLEKGSANAFTKLMNSDLSKTIAKSLGITLAGRTALALAPTLTSKLAIGAGLSAYGIYRLIKNRKETIKINETNELSNILMDLEITKEQDVYIDTRFNEETQILIRDFLKKNKIIYNDTGYRSLRQVIYALDNKTKKKLCILLNNHLGKDIDIENRINKAKKSLNVIATTASFIGSGFLLGTHVANTINTIDPALLAAPLNGTVLGAWMESVSDKNWLTALTGGLGAIGTKVLEHIPVVGGMATKVFAAENIATLSTIGAVGGLAVGAGLSISSLIKRIHANAKNKDELKKFLELDASKYNTIDQEELIKISESVHLPNNLLESTIIDIVLGYLKDDDIILNDNPHTLEELRISIYKLPNNEKNKAIKLLNVISDSLSKDSNFVKNLKRAGKLSIGLFITGAATLSVYDIIKGGTYLPELSKKLFPENNIYNPIIINSVDKPFNVSNESEKIMDDESRKIALEFNDMKYHILNTNDYKTAYGTSFIQNNPSLQGVYDGIAEINAGITQNVTDKIHIFDFLIPANSNSQELVPNVPAICERLDQLSPKELHSFTRYINNCSGGGEMLKTLKQIISYEKYQNITNEYINSIENIQKTNDFVNNTSNILATTAIPITLGKEVSGLEKKNSDFYNKEIESSTIKK